MYQHLVFIQVPVRAEMLWQVLMLSKDVTSDWTCVRNLLREGVESRFASAFSPGSRWHAQAASGALVKEACSRVC